MKQTTQIQKQPNCIDQNGHINIHPIIKIAKELNCPFIGLIGEKRIGKTYGCFAYGLQEFYKNEAVMFYARRYDKTFTENICGNLVRIHRQDIINLSKGKHNNCDLKGKYFDLVRDVENKNTGQITKTNRQHFAFCRSLNNIETETADDKGNVSCIVYDEFLTRGNELKDEFNKLMILHANATGKRDKFVPMFLLGNTVSRESEVAECFGIKLRDLKRGVNIITNTKNEPRIILFYSPETVKSTKSAKLFYDRFENDHINMIAHGDWTIGTYKIATQKQLSLDGYTILFNHNGVAVCGTITTEGMQPRFIITKPHEDYQLRVSSGLSKTAINYIPKPVINMITSGYMICETPVTGEDFRDICKHLVNGAQVVNYIG